MTEPPGSPGEGESGTSVPGVDGPGGRPGGQSWSPTGYGQPWGRPSYPVYGGPSPRTNGKAQAALWSGIALLVLSCCALGVFGVVPIALGVKARSEIRASGGGQTGDGLALTGIITGALAVVLSLALVALVVLIALAADAGFHGYGTTSV